MIDKNVLATLIASAVELTKAEIPYTDNPRSIIHDKQELDIMLSSNLNVILNIYSRLADELNYQV